MKRKTLAIPIRRVDFSDTSQVVALFTRENGLVDGIAKGAHREKNPFQGPFDLAVLYELVFIERRSGLSLLTEATVVDGFRALRTRWDAHLAACHVVEFLRVVAMAGDPALELFDLAAGTLGGLGGLGAAMTEAAVARFDARALRLLGLLAPIHACAGCGREWPGDRAIFVSAGAGGIVCSRCRAENAGLGGTSLPRPAARILRRLAEEEVELASGELEEGWKDFGRPVARIIAELRTNLLERELVLLKSRGGWI